MPSTTILVVREPTAIPPLVARQIRWTVEKGITRGTKWEYANANGNTLYKELIQILILILILILIHNKIDISMLRCLLLCLIVVVKLCPVVLRLFRRNNLSSYCKSFFKSWKIVFTFAVSWISHG